MTTLQQIAYSHGDTRLTGWLARPQRTPRAAILVFPTIANVTPAIERRAAMLADLGYLAFIADFYGEPVTDFAAAGPLADALRANTDHYRARLTAAVDALRGLPEAQGLPIAAIGYCMGGQAALECARAGHDLVASVSFHGLLSTAKPAQPNAIKARLLVCHGDADPLVPREQVLAFWEEMDAAGPIGTSTLTAVCATASPIRAVTRAEWRRSPITPAPTARAGWRCATSSTKSWLSRPRAPASHPPIGDRSTMSRRCGRPAPAALPA